MHYTEEVTNVKDITWSHSLKINFTFSLFAATLRKQERLFTVKLALSVHGQFDGADCTCLFVPRPPNLKQKMLQKHGRNEFVTSTFCISP